MTSTERVRAWNAAHPGVSAERSRQHYRGNRERYLAYWTVLRKTTQYGLAPGEFEEILASQDGACASCSEVLGEDRRNQHIDHDHGCCPPKKSCGKCVRGVICAQCNLLAGRIESTRGAAVLSYLARHREKGETA